MASNHKGDPSSLLAALRHPLRRQILKLSSEKASPISPRELSQILETPLSGVSYHVRALADCGAVVPAHTQQVRGSLQRFYVIDPTVDRTPWVRESLGLTP